MKHELALRTWQRAAEALGAAENMTRLGYHADAVSRAYYAVFYAARAATSAADYEILSGVSAEEAAARCSDARQFVERIRQYLLGMGLTAKELDSDSAQDNP